LLAHDITRTNLEVVVTSFYHKALRDDHIGHFFMLELGEDIENDAWEEHIDILVDFWASVFLDDPLYKSDPYGPHFTIIGLKKEHFATWMRLFGQTLREVYTLEVVEAFEAKALEYSKDFISRLDIDIKNPTLTSEYW
jgi:hemoglobin